MMGCLEPESEHSEGKQYKFLPQYRIILHADDETDTEYAVAMITKTIPSLDTRQATSKVEEAHKKGSCVLVITHFERAEHYQDRLSCCKPALLISLDKM